MAAARGRPSRETIFERFAAALQELEAFGGLPTPGEASAIWDDIWHLEVRNSTAFLDGNGRVGRLVLNLVPVRLGFRPAIIFKRNRESYLAALDQADRGESGRLAELLARSVIDNLHRFVVPNIAGPARLVPLRALEDNELTFEALRQAARRGRLEAHQGSDGVWRSSRHAVSKYKQARYQRLN